MHHRRIIAIEKTHAEEESTQRAEIPGEYVLLRSMNE